jgi:hypothetical protein
LNFNDTGQNGIFVIGCTYLQNDKIKNYHLEVDASEYANSYFDVDIDLYDSKVLSLTCYVRGQRDHNHNRRVNVYLVNQQGRGAATIVGMLAQQAITRYMPLNWPWNANVDTITPYGVPISLELTPSGNTVSFNVPSGWIFRFCSMRARLVTDATVADRYPMFYFDDGTIRAYESADLHKIVASNNIRLNYARGTADSQDTWRDRYNYPVPDIVAHEGSNFSIDIDNFQAGDSLAYAAIMGEYMYKG